MTMVGAGSRILAWRVVQKAANALAVLLAAKALGPVGQGHYALTMTLTLVLASVLNGGVGLAAVPALRRGDVAPRRALAAQALWSAVIGGLLTLAALTLPGSSLWAELTTRLGWDVATMLAAAVTVLALLTFDVHSYDLLVAGRLVTGTLLGALRASAHLAILGGLAFLGELTLPAAIISYAAVHTAAAVAIAVAAWRVVPRMAQAAAPPAGPALPQLAGRLLRAGWLGQLSGVSYLLLLRADQGFLEFGHGAAAVGIYSVAVWAAEMLWLLPEAINPLLVHASADETDRGARCRGRARRARGRRRDHRRRARPRAAGPAIVHRAARRRLPRGGAGPAGAAAGDRPARPGRRARRRFHRARAAGLEHPGERRHRGGERRPLSALGSRRRGGGRGLGLDGGLRAG